MIRQIDKDTILCMSLAARPGNFGNRFFNYVFGELDLNYIYKSFSTNDLPAALNGVRALSVRGCALSMPFKEQALDLLDEVDQTARAIGAVNTVVNDGGKLSGYNTDFLAVRKLLEGSKLPADSRVALKGSGGMCRAIAHALKSLDFKQTTLVARNQHTGKSIADSCGFNYLSDLNGGNYDLLINATPVGMAPDPPDRTPFTEDQVKASRAILESVAEPVDTAFLLTARQHGKAIMSGFDIIVLQALEQFKLYTGKTIPLELAQTAARHARS